MNKQRTAQWQLILGLSEKMAEYVDNEDWETLVDSEVKRQKLLKEFFSEDTAVVDSKEIASGIEKILCSDREISKAAQLMRQDIREKLGKFAENRRATQAYNQYCK